MGVVAVYAAAGLLVAAFVLLGIVGAATRPRRPDAGESTMELGAEPPAVVDLVTDDFEVTPEAVPATLVDLAARRWLDIESVGAGEILCRMRREGNGELTPYERRVLDHVRGLAVDGVVPAAALTTGPEGASRSWWRGFEREVVSDAQARGLCRRRWPPFVAAVSWLAVIGAGVLLWASGIDTAEEDGAAAAGALAAALLALGAISTRVGASKRQRETGAGLEVASRWLGVRRYLADHGDFASQPASSVAVWDRYLAHAVALDLATTAVEQLPLGAEDDRHAWSSQGGRWRQVTVDYPRFRPGWGRHPAAAILLGVLGAGLSGAVIWAAYRFSQDTTLDGLLDDVDAVLLDRLGWAALLVCVIFLAPFTYAVIEVWRGAADLFSHETVEGVVLRRRTRSPGLQAPKVVRYFTDPARRGSKDREPRYYVAVDEGRYPRVEAWRVRRVVYHQVRQHQQATAHIRPRTGHVRRFVTEGLPAQAEPEVVLDHAATADLLAAAEHLRRSTTGPGTTTQPD